MTAYELADALQETEPYYSTDYKLFDNAANILRQQADRIAHLEMLVANRNEIIDKLDLKQQPKPLSDEKICQLWKASQEDGIGISLGYTTQEHYFARLIEERHGIK